MNCIIVEDEPAAANYLEYQLAETGHPVEVLVRLNSVEKTVEWLKHHQTDVIFLDVQLSDGLSFEIFDHVEVNTPVIFTTSFDHYAIQAFDLNSISYLLKPISPDHLQIALDKYLSLYEGTISLQTKINTIHTDYQRRFLVESGTNLKTIEVDDAAYFHIQNKRNLILTCKDGKQYLIDNNLERLEQRLDPAIFFRINRQFIINVGAIKNMTSGERGRIRIDVLPECKEEVTVAITKVLAFRDWLNR